MKRPGTIRMQQGIQGEGLPGIPGTCYLYMGLAMGWRKQD